MGQGVILAKGTGQITTEGTDREYQFAGMKMEQRLFFNRIQSQRSNFSIV